MDTDQKWTEEVIEEIDKTIARGNVDKDTLELMKELLRDSKVQTSITAYFKSFRPNKEV
jgi:hypothetical protein